MKKVILASLGICLAVLLLCGCSTSNASTQTEESYQETQMVQANTEIGMPNVTEFFEKKMLKEIIEMRDDSKLICYAYTKNEYTGKYIYIGKCMGFGIPYSTQYTNPSKSEKYYSGGDYYILPQADPNGLYSSGSTSATWLMMVGDSGDTYISYCEETITVQQQKMSRHLIEEWSLPSDY